MALSVYQCATGIARINSSIGLDEIFESVDTQMIAPQCGHNTHGNGLTDAEGIANRQNHITDFGAFDTT